MAAGAASKVIDAAKAGVVGDGATLNTARIQKLIDDCSAAGGGTIAFPAGRYLTGTIQIKSNVTLRLDDRRDPARQHGCRRLPQPRPVH